MSYKIVALPGDGIGPEILSGTLELLKLISEKYHFEYHLESHHFGGVSIDYYGTPLTNETLQSCKMQMLFYQARLEGLNGQTK